MVHIVNMPAIVADAAEVILQSWLVSPGDTIAVGQPIAEVETEKASLELESDGAGALARILVEPGASVHVGAPVAALADENVEPEVIDAAVATVTGTVGSGASGAEMEDSGSDGAESNQPAAEIADDETVSEPAQPAAKRVFASPLARKRAKELGVDVALVSGSGPGGRIIRSDVEAAHRDMPTQDFAPAVAQSVAAKTGTSDESYVDVPVTPMRRAIARRLTESKATIPHFYVSMDVQMDALIAFQADVNEALGANGLKASINDLILKAVGVILVDIPTANVSWRGDSIRHYRHADVAMAVATDGGLLTPVIRAVDTISLSTLCEITGDFKTRAQSGRIKQDELDGGSITVTNMGMLGVGSFSAIINPPQAAILAIGAVEPRCVVREGDIEVANMVTCTLSADHRVIDGVVAAQFLKQLKDSLEQPLSLLV